MDGNLPSKWVDVTNYDHRGDVGPVSWVAVFFGMRVWVSSDHRSHPDCWVVSCVAAEIDAKKIAEKDSSKDQAQIAALLYVAAKLEAKADKFAAASIVMREQAAAQ